MANIKKTFTYKIPNEWGFDDFSEGKTGEWTYEGPEFITLEIDKETGEEAGWCLIYPEELERPCPENIVRITVDCNDNPLLCEIANDQGQDKAQQLRFTREWEVQVKAPEGYPDIMKPVVVEPRDIYDEFNITYNFETEEFHIPVRTYASTGNQMDLTWDDVRTVRDRHLKEMDGRISDDMPESLKANILEYRQKLRDLPNKMIEMGLEPWMAPFMFPEHPDSKDAPQPGTL